MKKRPKVLILAPAETADGGIKNYYQVLKNYFSIPVYYQYRGAREWPYRGSSFSEGIRLLKDYISYFINVILKHIQIVHINTSLGRESILISEIQGRIFDKIVGINGKIVHGGFFDDLILKSSARINKWQIVQSDIDCLRLYYISSNDISMDSKNYIENHIKKQLGLNTKVIFEKKDYLMPEVNGKYKFVKSLLY